MRAAVRERIATEALLRRCQMPPVEIGWVLDAPDPATVHMILELHRERLEEELNERRRQLAAVESRLAGTDRTAIPQ